MLSRREFLISAARLAPLGGTLTLAAASTSFPSLLGVMPALAASSRLDAIVKAAPRARFWTSVTAAGTNCGACHAPAESVTDTRHIHHPDLVKCLLCARGCVIEAGQRGVCRARMNVNGELKSLVYGRPLAIHVDPIEKKPFYHFLPGASAFSLATSGCPLRCKFCQNWELSQASPEDYETGFKRPVEIADAAAGDRIPVIAYTYNEATVFTEYLLDIAAEGRKKGLRSVLISCGFMNEAPLGEMCRVLEAIKIDLKGFSDEFYRTVCSAELKPVLRSIRQVAASGVHLEIVNLVVPTLNDSERGFQEMTRWVAGELGPDVPIHFTRFHPEYQMLNLPPTPVSTLERAREIAMTGGMRYAYVGNVPGHPGNHTYCPKCRKPVIQRSDFLVLAMHVKNGACEYCGQRIAGVWS
jgi:pyruvate formate lyase activating enzyme